MTEQPSRDEFRRHFDASAFRRDTWNQLKQLSTRVDRTSARGGDVDADVAELGQILDVMQRVERFWCFPGVQSCQDLRRALQRAQYRHLAHEVSGLVRLLVSQSYRRQSGGEAAADETPDGDEGASRPTLEPPLRGDTRCYFEVLVVDDLAPDEQREVRAKLLAMRRDDDKFIYDIVVVSSVEDALIAAQCNPNLQTCVLRYDVPVESRAPIPELRDYLGLVRTAAIRRATGAEQSAEIARALRGLRPEMDLFLNTDEPVEEIAGRIDSDFRRVFYSQEDYLELHLSILKGISERYETPFFAAVREHSQKPTEVFHALPISRGKSVTRSNWIQDMAQFYGTNIFLAETSATSGGLDSLLQPHGPLKRAQAKAARAFGARRTYFVTNGTSAANKIVMQALCRQSDIVLVSHDCHKSHHYALVLSGAQPIYMDPYPLNRYTMYGAVPLAEMKRHLLLLRAKGQLHRVRMVLLTNCTFDGIVYHPLRVMQELLAIKPDLIFVWDEAWFAFARFIPLYRQRTAMEAACRLRRELKSESYRRRYEEWRAAFDASDEDAWQQPGLMPDPDAARVRVYATQSTHKTLTSLRQGSMIHIFDQDFERKEIEAFQEAYMTYTSTSPNYQILASLDVGRRQVELEGFELVRRTVELAMLLRERIAENVLLRRHFDVLTVLDLIPAANRESGLERLYDFDTGFQRLEEAWSRDEFVLDPARITVSVGKCGIDGDTFRRMLMDKYDIQINKTSRNTLLFMLTIGTTRGAVAYLLKVLVEIARELEESFDHHSARERRIHDARVRSLTETLPPLPNFSAFHDALRPDPGGQTAEGDLRTAFFLAYEEALCDYVPLNLALAERVDGGETLVSASFVTPYPPGFPVLVPGQIVSADIVRYLVALDVKEIHGFDAEYGLRVFTPAALERLAAEAPAARLTTEARP